MLLLLQPVSASTPSAPSVRSGPRGAGRQAGTRVTDRESEHKNRSGKITKKGERSSSTRGTGTTVGKSREFLSDLGRARAICHVLSWRERGPEKGVTDDEEEC